MLLTGAVTLVMRGGWEGERGGVKDGLVLDVGCGDWGITSVLLEEITE